MAHLGGALAGLLVGIFALDNRRVRRWEPWVQWASVTLFACLVLFAVVWNIFADAWTEGGFYPPVDRWSQDNCSATYYAPPPPPPPPSPTEQE